MSSSEVMRPELSAKGMLRVSAILLGLGVLGGCQVQPLYGNLSAESQSVTVSRADSRAEQVIRNELVLGFGGEQPAGAYTLDLGATSRVGGLLPGGVDNEFSAARATVTATYVLKTTETGDIIKRGTRSADAQLDLPLQNFTQERAKFEAETRAAKAVAGQVLADVAAALAR
jgi:LPS-assembly lipoprotein